MIPKKLCGRLGLLLLLLQLVGSTLVGNAAVQAPGTAVGCLPLPSEQVCFSVAAPGSTAPQYLNITFSGVVTPGAAITNGLYPGFCVDEVGDILPIAPPGFCGITLRYLTDPLTATLTHVPAKIVSNTSAINWILNNRGSTPGGIVVEAIWAFTDGSTTYTAYPAAVALVNGALANPGYVPAPGERQAVLLDGGAVWNDPYDFGGGLVARRQWLVVEVTCPVPPLACGVGPQSAQTVCYGGSATFTATAFGGVAPFTYLWSGPGGFSSTDATITVSAAGSYSVVVSDSKNQSSTCSAVLTVLAPLTVAVNGAEICSGDDAILTATPSEPGVTYLWSPGGATTQSITVTPASKSVYTVTVFKGGCSGSNIGTVFVNTPPTVSLPAVSTCPGTNVTLVPVVSANVVSYLWSNGATTPTITVAPTVATTYSVTVFNNKGCDASASVTVGMLNCPTTCIRTPGGHTLGFWSNKNGQALETCSDFTGLTAFNLRNADGSNRNFTGTLAANKTALNGWLLSANANNMANMLSAQMTATYLSTKHGFTDVNVYVDGTRKVNAEIAYANSLLANPIVGGPFNGQNGSVTIGSSALRIEQERVKNILDAINNNKSFVQPTPCCH